LLQSLAGRVAGAAESAAVFNVLTPLPWRLDQAPALTVFDDCEAFDAGRQRAAFALFVDATSRGALIAAAGRMPPVDLPLRDDLRTRLGWGHVIALHALNEAEVALVLHEEAARRGINLPDELRAYLLSHFSRDLKSLMNLLERVYEFAHAHKRALTVPMLKQMLIDEPLPGDAAP
jgi:DnaA family protein